MTSIHRFRGAITSLHYPAALIAALHTLSCGDDTTNPPLSVDAGDAGSVSSSAEADTTFVDPSSAGVDATTVTNVDSTDTAIPNATGAPDAGASGSQASEADAEATVLTMAAIDAAIEGTASAHIDASHSDVTEAHADVETTSFEITSTDPETMSSDITSADPDVMTTETSADPDGPSSDPGDTSSDVSSPDDALADDAGVCEPLTEPLVTAIVPVMDTTLDAGDASTHDASWLTGEDAGAGDASSPGVDTADTCFPSCITDLEALCLPSGACGFNTIGESFGACWDNGLEMEQQLVYLADAQQVVTRLRVANRLCYEVSYEAFSLNAPNTITWRDSCNRLIARGIQTESDTAAYEVTCVDTDETKLVSFTSAACSGYVNGAPWPSNCSASECQVSAAR